MLESFHTLQIIMSQFKFGLSAFGYSIVIGYNALVNLQSDTQIKDRV